MDKFEENNYLAKSLIRVMSKAANTFSKVKLAPTLALEIMPTLSLDIFGLFFAESNAVNGLLYLSDSGEDYRVCKFDYETNNIIISTLTSGEISNLTEFDDKEIAGLPYLKKYASGNFIALPIKKEGTFGVLFIGRDHSHPRFSADEVEICSSISDFCASLISNYNENVSLSEQMDELVRHNRQLELVGTAARKIGSILDPQTLLLRLLDEINNAMPSDKSAVFLYDALNNNISDILSRGLSDEEEELEYIKVKESTVFKAISEATDILIEEDAESGDVSFGNCNAQSLLVSPILIKGTVFGAICLCSEKSKRFDSFDLKLLGDYAKIAADGIENSRIFGSERKRSLQLLLIHEVSKTALLTISRDEFFHNIVHKIKDKFNYYNVAIFTVNDDNSSLSLSTSIGGYDDIFPILLPIANDAPPPGKAAITKESILVSEIADSTVLFDNDVNINKTKSELSVPIIINSEVVAVLDIHSRLTNAFESNDVAAMEALVSKLAGILQNTSLYEQAAKRVNEMTLINEVSRSILGKVQSRSLLQNIVSLINDSFEYYNTALFLIAPDDENYLQLVAHSGAYENIPNMSDRIKIGDGFIGLAAANKEVVFSNDANNDPRFKETPILLNKVSEFTVPITIDDKVIGVLDVQQDFAEAFSESDENTIRLLADQIAVILENSRLFAREQHASRDSEAILQISRIVSQTLDLNEALERLVSETNSAVGTEFCSLIMFSSNGVFSHYEAVECNSEEVKKGLINGERNLFMPEFFSGVIDLSRIFVIYDAEEYSMLDTKLVKEIGISTIAVAPILIKGRLIGLLLCGWSQLATGTANSALGLLEGIAIQASIAIENLTYFRDISENNDYHLILSSIAADASRQVALDELLNSALSKILRFIDFDAGIVLIKNERSDNSSIGAEIGFKTQDAKPVFVRQEQIDELYSTIPNTESELTMHYENSSELKQLLPDEFRNGIVLTYLLVSKTDILGKVLLFGNKKNNIDRTIATLLQSICDQLSIYIENSILFNYTNKQMNELMTLFQTSKQLSSSLDPEEIIYNIAREVKSLVGTEDCTVFLIDNEGEYLEPIVSLTPYPEEYMNIRLKIGEGLTGYVAKTGVAEYVNEDDSRSIQVDGTPEEEHGLLCVPLISREEVIGVMTLSLITGEKFNDWDLQLVSLFASQVSSQIENARLIDRILSTMTVAEEHRRKLNAIFSSISDAIIVTDSELNIIETNRAVERLLGVPEDELIDTYIGRYLNNETYINACKEIIVDYKNSQNKELNILLEENNSRIRYYAINIDILRNAQGEPVGLISTFRDITEIKEMHLLKENFISNVSHELRTPLTSIIGSAELILEDASSDLPFFQFVKIIEKEAYRLRGLLDSILDFSLLESGSIELQLEYLDLNYLCDELVQRYGPLADDLGVTLSYTPLSNLRMVNVDQRLIESAIANLIKNSIQFNYNGGWVKIHAEQDERWVKIIVADNGPGVPEEQQKYIFEKFYQIDSSASRSVGGTGLGLSLVKEAVETHNGIVELKSVSGQGTTFTIYLPVGDIQ